MENIQIEKNQKKYTNNKMEDKKKSYKEKNLYYKNGKLVNKNFEYKKNISDKEQDDMCKRIYHLVKNKVNFISGTVAPATSSKRENYLNIEDLGIGFEFLSSQYDYNYTFIANMLLVPLTPICMNLAVATVVPVLFSLSPEAFISIF